MISIGSNNQWSTEVDMHEKTRCKIHTFDCSSNDTRPKRIRDRATFYKICVGAADETDPHGQQFLTWHSALEAAGHIQAPDYVKMDIEGFEYGVIANLLRGDRAELPNQIAMEIHQSTW